jgi:hypothetical protein
MPNLIRTSTLAAMLLMASAAANADEITLTFTGDNITQMALCDSLECDTLAEIFDLTANWNDWTQADSISLDLGPGTYSFIWYATNDGAPGSGNPAGFLAEVSWQGNVNSSSSAWDVSANYLDTASWSAATQWGSNGGDNIWGNNLGGAVAGISTNANWLWNEDNFANLRNETLYFRTTIKVVPEPGVLALFGLGLVGIGFARRARRSN